MVQNWHTKADRGGTRRLGQMQGGGGTWVRYSILPQFLQGRNPSFSMSARNLERSHHSTGSRTICTVNPTTMAIRAMNAGPSRAARLAAPDRGFHAGKKASTAANKAKLLTLSRHGDGGTAPPTARARPSADFGFEGSMPPPGTGERLTLPLTLPMSRVPRPTSHRYRDHSIPNIVLVQVMNITQLSLSLS